MAVTRRVWDEVITPDERARPWGQSEQGRLWDVLYLAACYARRNANKSVFLYQVSMIMLEKQRRTITLKAKIGGEAPEGGPCLTIMREDED